MPHKFHMRAKYHMNVVLGREEDAGAAGILDLHLVYQVRILQVYTKTGDAVLHIHDIIFAAQALYYKSSDARPVFLLQQNACRLFYFKSLTSRGLQV